MFILGGYQTDFARKWAREGKNVDALIAETIGATLADAQVDAGEIGVGHLGNFVGELFCNQGNMGGFFAEADAAFDGLPVARHEAACASGSIAVNAAGADIESGRYDTALVVGVEYMRNASALDVQKYLGVAAWHPHELDGIDYGWPQLFSDVADEYELRYGLDPVYLEALVRSDFANAKRNPNAQTRDWDVPDDFSDESVNPVVAGRIRRYDCSQVTDGGCGIVLASEQFTRDWAARRGIDIADVPRITGWGHRVGRMALSDKIADSRESEYVFPHVRATVADAFERAGIRGAEDIDAAEIHDCFSTSYYMAIDHLGLTGPGKCWQAIEDGRVFADGDTPVNPSGGLIGLGHPVGATGVRMVHDAARQVAGTAGECQVPGAERVATLNIGGSVTSVAAFVVGRG